jgi:hypothetical protein
MLSKNLHPYKNQPSIQETGRANKFKISPMRHSVDDLYDRESRELRLSHNNSMEP